MIDQQKLMERMGSVSLLRRLVDTLKRKVPQHLDALEKALAEGDAQTVNAEAHRLKGAVSNFEAAEAVELARQLETEAEAGSLVRAPELVAAFKAQMDQVFPELERICES